MQNEEHRGRNGLSNTSITKSKVVYCEVQEGEEGQRIDNYLLNKLKGLPKARVYRLLRKGEVRVNQGRISPFYRLKLGDRIRIPPVYIENSGKSVVPSRKTQDHLVNRIVYEDDSIIVLNKPSGMSVHAGNTIRIGVIEALKHYYPSLPQLELAHRLDQETSGCLLIAKKKRVLREIHQLLREGKVKKVYWALTKGKWHPSDLRVDVSLHKHFKDGGKHVVSPHPEGKTALTIFKPIKMFEQSSLMEVYLHTGRTHQIRVHAAYKGHPLAGDDRYGDKQYNQFAKSKGLKRLFLHARSIEFILPSSNQHIKVIAPFDEELEEVLSNF